MASVRIVLRKKKNSEGLFPIAIRISANKSSSFIFTNSNIQESEWNGKEREVKRAHQNSKRINASLLNKRREIERFIIENKLEEKNISGAEIKKLYLQSKQENQEASKKSNENLNFFSFAEERLKRLKAQGKFNHYGTLKSQIKILKEYAGANLTFKEVDQQYLEDLSIWLKTDKSGRKRSTRTVTDYLIAIKTLYNRAINQKFIAADNYPFGRNKVKLKLTQSLKVPLNKEDIEKLESVQLDETSEGRWNAKNIFLFSYYNAGMRFRDVICLKKDAIVDGALPYRMSKNEKPQYLKLHAKAKKIVEYYLQNHEEGMYLFPYMDAREIVDDFDWERRIKSINRTINNRLTGLAKTIGIKKKISMHIARHSFANQSGNKIPIQLLQVLYRHSSINTTIDYQRQFIQDELEEAINKVIDT